MGMVSGPQGKKDLNVELNLLPVFDILSVCICFLLMTVVWVEVRTLETNQTFGSESLKTDVNNRTLWVEVTPLKTIKVTYKQGEKILKQLNIPARDGKVDFKNLNQQTVDLKNWNLTSGQLLPSAQTSYQDVMSLFDILKRNGLNNLGLSPI